MISAKDIQKCVDKRATHICEDDDGYVLAYKEEPRLVKLGTKQRWDGDVIAYLGQIEVAEFQGKDWTDCIYKFERDYSQWIGKLCLFANKKENLTVENGHIGVLRMINKVDMSFSNDGWNDWSYCRPLKKDEVSFVEDCDD